MEESVILEDLSETISCSLQGIKDMDWSKEAAKSVKLLVLGEQSSLGDDIPPSNEIFGSAGVLSLNVHSPNVGHAGIFAELDMDECHSILVPSGPWGVPNTNKGGKVTGWPDGDVT